jgi:hypothetical protein
MMPSARIPGPEGVSGYRQVSDLGMLARGHLPLHGPIGFSAHPQPAKHSAPVFLGVHIHPKSQISAQDWVDKIKANKNVEDFIKDLLSVKGDAILVAHPNRLETPHDLVEKKDWLSDWGYAFYEGDWEITTSSLEISVKKGDAKGPFIVSVSRPDLESDEIKSAAVTKSPAGSTQDVVLTVHGRTVQPNRPPDTFKMDLGYTLESGIVLKSGRMAILITTRITLDIEGKVTKYVIDDNDLIRTWFHELSCHAGRNHLGGWKMLHGDPTVNHYTEEFDANFGASPSIDAVFRQIDAFEKSQKITHP